MAKQWCILSGSEWDAFTGTEWDEFIDCAEGAGNRWCVEATQLHSAGSTQHDIMNAGSTQSDTNSAGATQHDIHNAGSTKSDTNSAGSDASQLACD